MRDSQRAKVYRAERDAFAGFGSGPQPGLETVPEIERYVAKIMSYAWFERRWPDLGEPPRIRPGNGARSARGGATRLTLPRWARTEHVILHELAHCIVARTVGRREDVAAHGWQFCAVFLELVRYGIGREDASRLKAEFRHHRVRYTRPRAKRVLSDEEKAVLVERLARAREVKAAARV